MTVPRFPLSRLDAGVTDGGILIEGRTFRLDLVLFAFQHFIDALSREYGGVSSFLLSGKGEKELDWRSAKDRGELLKQIQVVTQYYRACGLFHIHLFDDCRARAFLLGNDNAVVDTQRRIYRTSRSRPIEEFDSEPKICFFGSGPQGPSCADFPAKATLPVKVADRIEALVKRPDVAKLFLRYERGPVIDIAAGDVILQDCRVAFPFEHYGESEREYMRVRCLGPDGRSIEEPERDFD